MSDLGVPFRLQGKVAVVTGAARGIDIAGPASAKVDFAPADAGELAQTGRLVTEAGGRWLAVTLDQRDLPALRDAAQSAKSAMELGEHKITVNALIPGLIDTVLTRHEDRYAQALQTAGKQPTGDPAADEKAARESLAAKSPLGVPWIEPEDVAPMVVFLASDEARMVSGGTFPVTAGDSANISA